MFQRIAPLVLIMFILTNCEYLADSSEDLYKSQQLAYLKLEDELLSIELVADSIDIPWEITLENDDFLWFTEQKGTINRLDLKTGQKKRIFQVPDVKYKKSYGLLGMTLHPEFEENPLIFVHYTYSSILEDKTEVIKSKIVRYEYDGNGLVSPLVILDNIPGNTYHNGSRLIISPDRKLFFSMGDTGQTKLTQDIHTLNGKILRLNLDGTIPEDNPFQGNPVWTWGHRNPQGMIFTSDGKLFSSEHGPNNDDEINLIEKSSNYGWPNVQGFDDQEMEKQYTADSVIKFPLKSWTPTLGVAGLDYYGDGVINSWQNSLILVNLKGRALRVLKLNNEEDKVMEEHIYFQKYLGRLRDVCISNAGDVYLSTSNRDWHPRFQPWMYDSLPEGGDRIIRIRKLENDNMLSDVPVNKILTEDAEAMSLLTENWEFNPEEEDMDVGQRLYMLHCASCHQPNGEGNIGMIPPLTPNEWVGGNKGRFIRAILNGLSEPIVVNEVSYNQEMPGYAYLDDEALAAIMTYVRNSFGNEESAVIPGEVYEERK